MIYIVILLLLLLLSFIYDINGVKGKRDFWYVSMLIVFILISGFRWRLGVDTTGYLDRFYHEYPTIDKFSFDDYSFFSNPLYVIMNSLVITLGGKFYWVQLLHASFVNILIFKFIRKHTKYIFICLLFYAIVAYSKYNFEIMKGSMSIAICLFANDYILEKKWCKGYLLYCLALLFHAQTILLFILPFLFFLKLNIKGVIFLCFAFLLGRILMNFMADYLFLLEVAEDLEDKTETYMNSDKYSGQNGNLNFYIVNFVLLVFYPVISLLFAKFRTPSTKLLKLEPFVMIGLVFVMIRANVEIAYRYVDYYLIYFCLFYSNFFVGIFKTKRLGLSISCIRTLVMFIPFLFLGFVNGYILDEEVRSRYNPYKTVFDRSIDHHREAVFSKLKNYKAPHINEY